MISKKGVGSMEKKLGLGSGVAICVGLIVATSCLVSLGTGMGSIGRWFIIPLFMVMFLNWFIGISFAELNGLMPRVQGGTGQYLLAGMGPLPSLIGNLSAYVITEILSMTAEITLCGLVLKSLFLPNVDNRIISVAIMAVFLIVNLFGVDIFSKVQNVVVFLLIGSMVLIGLALLFVVQSILGIGMTNYVSLDALANDPNSTPHMTYATNLLGNAGRIWMGIITILAAASTINTVYASISKIMQGMGEEGMMPGIFAKTNKRGAAWVGLVVLFVFVSTIIISNLGATEGVSFLLLSGSCFWLLTYCLVHATVLILRKRNPEYPRKKWLTLAGIPQIIGILGNLYMIWNIDSGDARIKIFKLCGTVFVILVVYSVIWVCGVMKARPFQPVPVEVINDASVKFDELVRKENELKGAEGEVS